MPCLPIFFALSALLSFSLAQFPPRPTGLSTTVSKLNKQVKLSWKEIEICETTKGTKAYSGYVHIPGSLLADVGGHDVNTYFLYFEARHNASTAPLGIYIAGGPGESSTYSAFDSESGPCYVNEAGNDTVLNPWSFNNNFNMLYLDQPIQTGFSYETLVNGTFNLDTQIILPTEYDGPTAAQINITTSVGTFPNQNPWHTTNTTVSSARAIWHVAEHWLSSFPQYTSSSNKVSVIGNSYGGFWVPEIAVQLSKNFKKLPKAHPLKAKNLTLDTMSFTNGCIDSEYLVAGFVDYAYNNTYGIRFIDKDTYDALMHNITAPGGVTDLVKQCRALAATGDPLGMGTNTTVNEACELAYLESGNIIYAAPALNNRSAFDIAVIEPDPCTYDLATTNYLNLPHVQQALGVPLNFTYDSELITGLYGSPTPYPYPGTGDAARQLGLLNLEYLLQTGVKVALAYGDRDYRCPWTGGEATVKAAIWKDQSNFLMAGYTPIKGVKSGDQGLVKQFGNLSFSRVFNSGHSLNAYAPEMAYRIFERAMFGRDIATGETIVENGYKTEGPTDSWGWRNTLPSTLPKTCMKAGKWTKTNPWNSLLAPDEGGIGNGTST